MKYFFEFEVVTENGAFCFHTWKKVDHRKMRKDFKKFIKCEDVSLLVYTKLNDKREMLIDRVFCSKLKDISL